MIVHSVYKHLMGTVDYPIKTQPVGDSLVAWVETRSRKMQLL